MRMIPKIRNGKAKQTKDDRRAKRQKRCEVHLSIIEELHKQQSKYVNKREEMR